MPTLSGSSTQYQQAPYRVSPRSYPRPRQKLLSTALCDALLARVIGYTSAEGAVERPSQCDLFFPRPGYGSPFCIRRSASKSFRHMHSCFASFLRSRSNFISCVVDWLLSRF